MRLVADMGVALTPSTLLCGGLWYFKKREAAQIIALQSSHVRRLFDDGYIEDFRHMEMEKILAELYNQQGGSERIKNFPYPRQFTTISLWLIKIFICLYPTNFII